MSTGRDWYRIGLLAACILTMREIASVRLEKAARAVDDLEPVDCTDVLAAHGVAVS